MMFRDGHGSFWGKRGIESIEENQPKQRAEDVYEMAEFTDLPRCICPVDPDDPDEDEPGGWLWTCPVHGR